MIDPDRPALLDAVVGCLYRSCLKRGLRFELRVRLHPHDAGIDAAHATESDQMRMESRGYLSRLHHHRYHCCLTAMLRQ